MRLALGLLLAVVALAACGGRRSSDTSTAPRGLLDGIPQQGVVLGDAGAPVTVVEDARGAPTGEPLRFLGRGAATAAAYRTAVNALLVAAVEGTA